VFVVPDPGASRLAIAGCEHARFLLDQRWRFRGPVEQFVAVGRGHDRRVEEHLPGENERTHDSL
jgi:hypothetical protein